MVAQFPHLSKLGTKLLEIAAAACVSACVALLLGNLREAPSPPLPPIVRLAPADEQLIRDVREESVALVQQFRAASELRIAAVAIKPTPTSTGKPIKVVSGALVQREHAEIRTPASESEFRTAALAN
jgi:hypothetical protein